MKTAIDHARLKQIRNCQGYKVEELLQSLQLLHTMLMNKKQIADQYAQATGEEYRQSLLGAMQLTDDQLMQMLNIYQPED